MYQSEYRAAAQGAIAYVKAHVQYRGLNTPGGWIRNPLEMNQKIVARIDSTITGLKRSSEYKGGFNRELYVNEMDRLARDTQTGNCSELSAVAFNYLKVQGVIPIDYFGVFRGNWDHAFVILNRDAIIPLSDFAKWSEYAVLCDPLYDRSADAGFLATWYPRIYPFKASDLVYRLE
jgi:hypothetical protein